VVFAYNIAGDYPARCHPISPRWDTVAMPTEEFRLLARRVEEFLGSPGALRITAAQERS